MKTIRYPILLLDADRTLFDFEKSKAAALQAAYQGAGLEAVQTYSPEILARYSDINESWWRRLERGECTKPQLQIGRFREFFAALGVQADPAAFNQMYMNELGNGSYLLPHALEVCRELAKDCRLYIVTNGVSETQRRRIDASPLAELLSGIFISEEAGFPKPDVRYFDYVFSRIPGVERREILLVGDSLTSDMQGAENAGLDSCWFNPAGQKRPSQPAITYEIWDLRQLPALVRTGCLSEEKPL